MNLQLPVKQKDGQTGAEHNRDLPLSKASWQSIDHINGILARLVSGTTMVETFFQKPR